MNLFDAPNINILWGNLIVEELIRNGASYFIVSPGSRSTPLTVAIARYSQAQRRVFLDERGAAFHAIGYARATGKPAVLVSTSGSAAANYFPAVIEAATDNLPMIIISADRPPELRKTGANQTIDQVNLYGDYVRWKFDIPCPDEKISPTFVLTTIDQAVYRAKRSHGPVHLNCMFREPLAPTNSAITLGYTLPLKPWLNSGRAWTDYPIPMVMQTDDNIHEISAILNNTKRGILALGRLNTMAQIRGVEKFAHKLQFPIFADIRSGLRLGNTIDNQLFVTDIGLSDDPLETVIQIGDRILSKRFLEYLPTHPPRYYIMITDSPSRHDPAHIVSHRIESNIEKLCESLLPLLAPNLSEDWQDKLWLKSLKIRETIDSYLTKDSTLNEMAIAHLVSQHIPADSGLFLANSMPIRDMDEYGIYGGNSVRIAANRGTSGIDGIIASAAGFCQGLNTPTTLLIGDLAFLHDLNSLSMVNSLNHPLWIIVINNNGGGIFSFLPIAKFNDVFENYFATPHNLQFDQAAKLFNLNYFSPPTPEEFVKDYQQAIASQTSAIIEVQTNRKQNQELHQELADKIREISWRF
ncbi:MAG: 2-succinyl-5-enolpyruvyl-6-hydroxy-3-cyclohexene-1-carboxylic-acid synthase [Limnospira sp. PMC 1291.21]|uniref:2-succinyl-5-enolpyruvyl-6-hydroxy-3-cyclohexene-1-carboxylate synthase n=3 Tax=Limnospira TaxID=2596745 RepID=A0ABU9ERV3_LIMFS|nr:MULTISPECIES: 2-succinyl-5-enolpyruvyl-6-hydroxy-3-cyclohexene-1-carboxylic-acid synthase [unclassified Limnospira]EKD06414.1 2-succinyl-6-hydroxy-24-cyclohexadiene-1-carboxylic acidsynthase/2-oxoglutarate decarboxylase [Arthrospira platensis C1]MBD2670430.1 2-succinyl-5-enolpyruvyl-6-hydroxy-3-cyclohexene-1-carboxylic-acid synthase [Arthrospira platensis FACHB-439]MDT9178854.1 2-succinyl-5-enolpyruvyl-6-hydroxy-3-cyclohexene-1-carboxylic-acid synthase [Limnospira sp. PMC 1238.20]MDT9189215.